MFPNITIVKDTLEKVEGDNSESEYYSVGSDGDEKNVIVEINPYYININKKTESRQIYTHMCYIMHKLTVDDDTIIMSDKKFSNYFDKTKNINID